MASFQVEGGNRLAGEIFPQGAKNEALQIISAVLLTSETVHLYNVPNIRDVNKLIELLIDFGVVVEKTSEDSYKFTASRVDLDFLETQTFREKASSLRGSIMLLGPLLARFGVGKMPKPGASSGERTRNSPNLCCYGNVGVVGLQYLLLNELESVGNQNHRG
jgi:UDP-N-acetylglucosamine 1-carboxyvinyltransferase